MEVIQRGDLITIALRGNHGKPRPALVIQSDAFNMLPSVTVLRITSDLYDWPLFRITVELSLNNGLRKKSQIMIDKPATVPREKIGKRIGRLEITVMHQVEEALTAFLGLR